MKKFERFAQRSSLRRVNSPRQGQEKSSGEKDKTSDNKVNHNNNEAESTTKVTTDNKMSNNNNNKNNNKQQTALKSPTLTKDIREGFNKKNSKI